MVHLASEMEREVFDIPLLIGGATTSRVHTAVKIAPRYTHGQAVYVTDASRAVGVVGALLSPAQKPDYVAGIQAEYADVADKHERGERAKNRLLLAKARANALKLDWDAYEPVAPSFTGARVLQDWDLAEIARYIDWTPFFQTWEMRGVYPGILEDEKQGAAARALFADAQAMLDQIIAERWFTPRGVVGFWPANAVGDDIRLYTGPDRAETLATLHTLRQQTVKRGDRPNVALSDFVAPEGHSADHVGGFVVTAGPEDSDIAEQLDKANDNYGAILVKALADRIAEAMAEMLHERARREFWVTQRVKTSTHRP